LDEKQSSNLAELVERMAPLQGLVGIILFGSVARGDADEYSDYDLLILFRDRASLRKAWDAVFEATGSMKLSIHAVPETLEELGKANPVFLRELEKHGKVIYSRFPFAARLAPTLGREYSLVSYDLATLSYKEKMRILYRLYEAGGQGVVGRRGGAKLSSGCLMIPTGAASEVVGILKSGGARAVRLDVLLEGEGVELDKRRPKLGTR
jgi:predicted nucleotidyltransferase